MNNIMVIGTPLYQWETGRKIQIIPLTDMRINAVHFSNFGDNEALVVKPREENGNIVADIPNILLQSGANLVIYTVNVSQDSIETLVDCTISVRNRAKPADYVYTEEEQYTVKALVKTAVDEAIPRVVEDTLNKAKESGEFDGEKGEKGDPFTYEDFTEEQLASLKGEPGEVPIVQTTGQSETEVMSQKATTDEFAKIVEHTCNLFNKDSEDIINGILSSKFTENASYFVTHPIKVDEGVTYRFAATYGSMGANGLKVAYVGEDGNLTISTAGAWYDDTQTSVVFTATKTGYVRVNIGTSKRLDPFMFCNADLYPNEYVPFAIFLKLPVPSENLQGAIPAKWLEEIMASSQSNILYGKKITLNGDSICYGAGSSGGYGKIIAENNGMTYQNVGVSGGTITAETYSENGNARHWICRTIENMDADADYAIVEGGVNDSSLRLPLGELSPTNDYSAAFDDSTFYGAFESMLRQLTIRFAGKKIGYIAVHQMSGNFVALKNDENSYYWAAKKCCEKWGVPFLDLNTTVPPFGMFSSTGNADLYALRTAYTHNGDGWHPNEEGYKKYYVPKIESRLKTL